MRDEHYPSDDVADGRRDGLDSRRGGAAPTNDAEVQRLPRVTAPTTTPSALGGDTA